MINIPEPPLDQIQSKIKSPDADLTDPSTRRTILTALYKDTCPALSFPPSSEIPHHFLYGHRDITSSSF